MTTAPNTNEPFITWIPTHTLPPCTEALSTTWASLKFITEETGGKLIMSAGMPFASIEGIGSESDLHTKIMSTTVEHMMFEIEWQAPFRRAAVFLCPDETSHTVHVTVRGGHVSHKVNGMKGVMHAFEALSKPRRVQRVTAKIARILSVALGGGGELREVIENP